MSVGPDRTDTWGSFQRWPVTTFYLIHYGAPVLATEAGTKDDDSGFPKSTTLLVAPDHAGRAQRPKLASRCCTRWSNPKHALLPAHSIMLEGMTAVSSNTTPRDLTMWQPPRTLPYGPTLGDSNLRRIGMTSNGGNHMSVSKKYAVLDVQQSRLNWPLATTPYQPTQRCLYQSILEMHESVGA